MTFVDYYKADYPVVRPATVPEDYQFYFVFLRENLFDVNSESVDVRRRREGVGFGKSKGREGMRVKGKSNNKEKEEGEKG